MEGIEPSHPLGTVSEAVAYAKFRHMDVQYHRWDSNPHTREGTGSHSVAYAIPPRWLGTGRGDRTHLNQLVTLVPSQRASPASI
jgi:hypothetical protein